ncbi:hypothetical protein HII36_05205 [Nonomuraea sp. NN258]|uniref:hypothetical protein n=1 Tax=Nonomuraea antri TaxID=2730852 RepID=UPI001568B4C9|nr:hypothetical protein [Nonomuraea antri]NRQ31234.1 hypothetical protein [Nonomuraea antri]
MHVAVDQAPAGVAEITDESAQQIADAISAHFRADPDYAPQVMHADWDGGSGRVIVWGHGLSDWAYLASGGGVSEDGDPTVYEPVPLPPGVWVEPVSPNALRVLPEG